MVALEVQESAVKPVSCRGRFLKRVGKSNRRMSDDDLTRAVLDKVGTTWDQVVEPRATLGDLDSGQLERFRRLCHLKGRRPIPPEEADQAVLEKLGLVRQGQPTRAAVLLLAKEPQRFYPSAFVKIGRFRSPTLIVDDREVYGTLFDQVESVLAYFREHLQTRFEFTGEPAREVLWEYPLEALREAIVNAVSHRDYLEAGHVQVRWHDDRVVIFNPGGLPSPLRLEELKREHPSVPRNRLVAEMFFFAGWVERWGSGIQRMLEAGVAAGLPDPEFEERTGGLWLTFRKDLWSKESLQSMGLSERQTGAVLHAKLHGSITNREYRQLAGLSDEASRKDLGHLVDIGILRAEGKGRAARYVLDKVGD